MVTLSAGSKRRRSSVPPPPPPPPCSTCQVVASNIEVGLPMGRKIVKTPLCWLHYYTSRAVREPRVTTIFHEENKEEIPDYVQVLFAEAFIELQQELAEESARAFQTQQQDPLGIIKSLRGSRTKPPPPAKRKEPKEKDAGGFLRDVPLPERFLRMQQQGHQQGIPATPKPRPSDDGYGNPYQRRKGSGKSIWNMALDKTQKSIQATMEGSFHSTSSCTCGATQVTSTGNVTNRNNDIKKGETWGVKDGPSVVVRYQCNQCGKTWNEEE